MGEGTDARRSSPRNEAALRCSVRAPFFLTRPQAQGCDSRQCLYWLYQHVLGQHRSSSRSTSTQTRRLAGRSFVRRRAWSSTFLIQVANPSREYRAANPKVPFIVILNPNSGPVTDKTSATLTCIPALRSSMPDLKIIGYVRTICEYLRHTRELYERSIDAKSDRWHPRSFARRRRHQDLRLLLDLID